MPVSRPEDVGQKGLKRISDLFPEVSEKRVDGVGWKYPAYQGGPGLLHQALKGMDGGDPYPLKAYLVYRHDPLTELPEPEKLKKLFANLDFLMVATSAWSETAWHADLILPLSTYLERESIVGQIDGLKPAFTLRRRCTAPRFETRADWEIVCGLAKHLGLEALDFHSVEEIWSYQLEGTGVRIQDFDTRGMVELAGQPQYGRMAHGFRFRTASGRIDMAGGRFLEQGLSCLSPYQAKERPAPGAFRLTVGGCSLHVEGHTVNNPLLFRQMPENMLWMNQSAAAQLGIADGEKVSISGREGSGAIRVSLTELIHPEAVFMVRGFGRSLPVESRARGKGLADNLLMAGGLDRQDGTGGGLALQEHFVTVGKIQEGF